MGYGYNKSSGIYLGIVRGSSTLRSDEVKPETPCRKACAQANYKLGLLDMTKKERKLSVSGFGTWISELGREKVKVIFSLGLWEFEKACLRLG